MSEPYFETEEYTLENILKLLNTTKNSFDNDVENMKQWLQIQLHLPEIMGDQQIRFFLIINKCNFEKTKRAIDTYYTIRSQIPDMYENINPKLPHMKEVMDAVYYVPLPKLTNEMERVIILKVPNPEMIDNLEAFNFVNHTFNVSEMRSNLDLMITDILIVDGTGLTWRFVRKFTISLLRKATQIYGSVYSFRLRAMYIINLPTFCKIALQFFQMIVKPKIFKRLKIENNWCDIKDMFPKRIIPRDLGGDEKSLEELNELLKVKMLEYQDRFDQVDTLRVNEELRASQADNDEVLSY